MTRKIQVVEIFRGNPIPEHYKRWPFEQLEIGDNFTFTLSKRNSVQSRASILQKNSNRRYVVHKIDNETGGVWRIADKTE